MILQGEENIEWNISVANQLPLMEKFTEMANEFIDFNNEIIEMKDRTLRISSED